MEKSSFSSNALQYEVRLREVFAATEGLGVPNIHRTAPNWIILKNWDGIPMA